MTKKRTHQRQPKRVTYLVAWNRHCGKWQVRRGRHLLGERSTRQGAHELARFIAKRRWKHEGRPTEVRLKNRRTGRFSADMERTFGNDPFPPKG